MSKLILILGDQLSHNISSLQEANKKVDTILMGEVWNEATYVKHHVKKIAFIFSAMRHFASELKEKGYKVIYHELDDKNNKSSFSSIIKRTLSQNKFTKIIITEPGEHRVLTEMESWPCLFNIDVNIIDDNRFLCSIDEFKIWEKNYKQPRMELFYRYMRARYNILMTKSGKPIGGKWNYDQDNREPVSSNIQIPNKQSFKPDSITSKVIKIVKERFSSHFGDIEGFGFAINRKQALQALDHFITHRLPSFGKYQDAMLEGEPWMFHSLISQYLNIGFLTPLECIQKAEAAYNDKKAPLNSVEGFIRQVLGWREYIRGIYWLKMPQYKTNNFLTAKRKLPDFFWTGETDLNCLKQCITETKQHAYAHHIQRLMVLGNFCLITGIAPKYVNEWYLIVYADAYEWVELPNVSGMILFADGGYLASKPYAAGGAYINKMSNYCKNCKYKIKEKTGDNACPFNYLYWNFLVKNKNLLSKNQRLSLVYSSLNRMDEKKIADIRESSKKFLSKI